MSNYARSTESIVDTFDFSTALTRLGLSQYEEHLRENGFEDWETVTAITETDMTELGFKMGDRRKLQRAIRDDGVFNVKATRTTRPYRRHPRPDPSAPRKPKTAYVLFGEYVRQDPALSSLSFTEIAKETGKRWRELSHEDRVNNWEKPGADRLRDYKEELETYKQTENYRNYQTYLEGFKQGHHNPELIIPSDSKAPSVSESTPLSQQPSLQGEEDFEATFQDSVGTDDLDLESWSQDTTSPVKSGMEEVRYVSKTLGVHPHSTRVAAFPPEDTTTKAVKDFLSSTGSLLYFWSQDEALNLIRSAYHPQSDSTSVHATEVFAMSAIGSYCDGVVDTTLPQENFVHFFLYMLSSSSDISNLRRMRLFACLAICRFTNSTESARRLMLSALNIGRQMFTSPTFRAQTSEEELRYWWDVLRSIIFLESWFAFNTGQKSRITIQDLTLYHTSHARAENDIGILQERVGQLGQLAAYIALDLKTGTQPKVAQARIHFETLNEWHRTLPPPMQLSQLSIADPLALNWHSKRSLLQLHILFLGVFIEPYRDGLVNLGHFRLNDTPIALEDVETLKIVEEQCILAARQSARVASLLQTSNLVRSHCWVSMYTSFTGCGVLLFGASQKLLELSAEEVGQDLSYASSHLSILSLCSYDNDIARRLYSTLQLIFNDIREVVASPVFRRMRELHIVVGNVALVPLSHYGAVEGAEEIIKNIVDLTRRIMGVLQESLEF